MGQDALVTRTLVSFHAHPDDEALLTAGTMARLVAEGHRVVLVFATDGGVGDADTGILDDGEDLASRRRHEALSSATAIGVHRTEFLGYADSGSDPDAPFALDSFAAADVGEAAARLAEILREERADAVTIYDPRGGYGHPDHLRVHEVGRIAAQLARTTVVLEATVDRDALKLGLMMAHQLGHAIPDELDLDLIDTTYSANADITHRVDVSAHLPAKRASMEAHTSQTTSTAASTRTLATFLDLPEDLFALAFGTEFFVEHGRDPVDDAAHPFDSLTSP
jgi:LmbE family N-acetylglucosaminyl deacetylase